MHKKWIIAPSADVMGRVTLSENTNVWYQVVIRGDINDIYIGKNTNIQDGSVVHVDTNHPVRIGDYVTVGHTCIIHGCTIENDALIGMGSTILNGAVIGKGAMIGAGSLVTQNTKIEPYMLALGRPAKVIRPLTEAEIKDNYENALRYVKASKEHLAGKYKVIK